MSRGWTLEKIRAGGDYSCLYCGQGCSSVEILMAHERDCKQRPAKEREWREERAKHSSRLGGMRRRKDGD